MEACLERYPQHRHSLEPLLEIARRLWDEQPEIAPSPYFVIELKSRLMREAKQSGKGGEPRRRRR